MTEQKRTTPADLGAALEKTVPSSAFDAAGTRRELSATQMEHATPDDAGHFLEKTVEDRTPTSATDTSGLEGFGESSEVPESLRATPDVRRDIYCLGATLYHLLTLKHPTWEDDPERFWEMKREGELSPLPRTS